MSLGDVFFMFAGVIALLGGGYLFGFSRGSKFVLKKLKELNQLERNT